MLNPNNKIILTMTSERKLTAIETDDVRVKLNGLSNTDYKTMLGAAGVELRFEEAKDEHKAEYKEPKILTHEEKLVAAPPAPLNDWDNIPL